MFLIPTPLNYWGGWGGSGASRSGSSLSAKSKKRHMGHGIQSELPAYIETKTGRPAFKHKGRPIFLKVGFFLLYPNMERSLFQVENLQYHYKMINLPDLSWQVGICTLSLFSDCFRRFRRHSSWQQWDFVAKICWLRGFWKSPPISFRFP